MKKLFINKETLRTLEEKILKGVYGGKPLVTKVDCEIPVVGDADDYANGAK